MQPAQAFIREEEEGSIPDHGAAENAARGVVSRRWLVDSAGVDEPVVGVEEAAAEVVKRVPRNRWFRARREGDLRAGRAPELGRVGRGVDAHLLHRVGRDDVVRAAEGRSAADSRRRLPGPARALTPKLTRAPSTVKYFALGRGR